MLRSEETESNIRELGNIIIDIVVFVIRIRKGNKIEL